MTSTVALKTSCLTASPIEYAAFGVSKAMPQLTPPQEFGQYGALSYTGSTYDVSFETPNGLIQSWTGEQRSNKSTGWGPDEEQYHWSKPNSVPDDRDRLTMFVPYFGSVGGHQLNRYSRAIDATIFGQGTVRAKTVCATGMPTAASDLPTASKVYDQDIDSRWGAVWPGDGAGGTKGGGYMPSGIAFRMEADFAAKTVVITMDMPDEEGQPLGSFAGSGTIGANGEISANLSAPEGELALRGSFFGPEASEFVLVYGLAADYNNDGTNDLTYIGHLGGRN